MNEHEIRENDYKHGCVGESQVCNVFRNKGFTFKKPNDRYCFYDYNINNKYLCEVKTRNCSKNRYSTTLIPFSKIQQYRQVKKHYENFLFVFCFSDGKWYTSYNELMQLVKQNVTIHIKPFTRYAGFQHATRKHVHVPVEVLKPLEQLVLE